MSSVLPCIDSNPDIAGIGVRTSVYVQALLNLICAFVFAKDGVISDYETTVLTKTAINLFITGCALLVAAFIQAGAAQFSVYHALIVLNLSWIIALSAVWYIMALSADNFLITMTCHGKLGKSRQALRDESRVKAAWPRTPTLFFLSIAQLSAMGALGILLWSKIDKFGDEQNCTPLTFLTVIFRDIPVTHHSLRRASLAIYSIAAFPFANIAVMVIVGVTITLILCAFWLSFIRCSPWVFPQGWGNRFLLTNGLVLMTFVETLFIVDTELMISRSRMLVKEGDSKWSFGQILAMLMLVIPLIETAKAVRKSWNLKTTEEKASERLSLSPRRRKPQQTRSPA